MVLDMLSRDHPRRMRQRAMAGQNFNNVGKIDDRPQVERNTLFLNRGDHTFTEIAQLSGVAASEWSWGIAFLDVDLDGYEDILITNGHGFDTQDSDTEDRIAALGPRIPNISSKLLLYPRLNVPNVAFRNRGDLTFEEVGAKWGFNFVGVSHDLALADLDNDGDLDVIINNLNAPAGIYRNETTAPRLAIRLRGRPGNVQGIGAKISLHGGPVPQSQQVICGGRYLSGDDPVRVFAAGSTGKVFSVEVAWRTGTQSLLTNLHANSIYEIDESASRARALAPSNAPRPGPVFREVPIAVSHHDTPFDDFASQSLLSRRLSQLGPGITWCDVDGDGFEDLLISSGKGGELTILENGSAVSPSRPPEERRTTFSQRLHRPSLIASNDDQTAGQNAAALKLYHNERARPGLRVRLQGPAGNRAAVGAILRVKYGNDWGPAREIHDGSGYWSQDAFTQIFGGDNPTSIRILWPGGSTSTLDIPFHSREILIDQRKGLAFQ